MSKALNICLSGGMGNLTWEEQTKWRNQVKNAILYGGYDYEYKPVFFDPTLHYNFEEKHHKSEREVFEYDLDAIRKSDLVIVNFNDQQSIGTAMEIMLAHELHIPVIGLNKDKVELHPWLIECVTRMCDDMRELVEHVVGFYLN